MDEQAAASLALDAFSALDGIRQDVAQIRDVNLQTFDLLNSQIQRVDEQMEAKGLSVEVPADPEAQNLLPGDSADWVTEVHSATEVPAGFFPDLMGFQYMHTVLFAFMLLALLLNLGATLWLAFSDKWRS